jgi:hypothetical protein
VGYLLARAMAKSAMDLPSGPDARRGHRGHPGRTLPQPSVRLDHPPLPRGRSRPAGSRRRRSMRSRQYGLADGGPRPRLSPCCRWRWRRTSTSIPPTGSSGAPCSRPGRESTWP